MTFWERRGQKAAECKQLLGWGSEEGSGNEWLDDVEFKGTEIIVMVDILLENQLTAGALRRVYARLDCELWLTRQYWLTHSNNVVYTSVSA